MNLGEMREAVRIDLGDLAQGGLWSDAEIDRWANEAETEACRRARLLVDSSSIPCFLTFPAGDPLAKLDARVMFVKRLLVVGEMLPLAKTCVAALDEERPGWEDESGSPSAWLADYRAGSIRLDRIPEEDVAVRMTVLRMPLRAMRSDTDTPEVAPRYHENLLHWIRWRAYSKQDADAMDPKAAATALALFEAEFGRRSSAQDETWIAAQNDFAASEGAY